jgi:hypothetical protein
MPLPQDGPLGTHAPWLQVLPGAQSPGVRHVDLHVVVSHAYGSQGVVATAGQIVSVPVHVASSVAVPFEHDATRHTVVELAKVQPGWHAQGLAPPSPPGGSHCSPLSTIPFPHCAGTLAVHVLGVPEQSQPVSVWQVGLQPSPGLALPSSHVSFGSMTPFGHPGTCAWRVEAMSLSPTSPRPLEQAAIPSARIAALARR